MKVPGVGQIRRPDKVVKNFIFFFNIIRDLEQAERLAVLMSYLFREDLSSRQLHTVVAQFLRGEMPGLSREE